MLHKCFLPLSIQELRFDCVGKFLLPPIKNQVVVYLSKNEFLFFNPDKKAEAIGLFEKLSSLVLFERRWSSTRDFPSSQLLTYNKQSTESGIMLLYYTAFASCPTTSKSSFSCTWKEKLKLIYACGCSTQMNLNGNRNDDCLVQKNTGVIWCFASNSFPVNFK